MTVIARSALLFLVALAGIGCQSGDAVMNEPLPAMATEAPNFDANYGTALINAGRIGESLVFLAFSGGGKRSAAFAHGVLDGLRHIGTGEGTLLEEVDYISAVSGGSFPAVHYGLHRDASFATFRRDFLDRDINSYVYGMYLLPWRWAWLVQPDHGTNDQMAAVYDRLMFHGATFGDLARRGPPLISVNATDIANGVPFAFLATNFGLLCSNLNSYPLARAVAASNGFPLLFSPITLQNHAAACRGARPLSSPVADWAGLNEQIERRAEFARIATRYADADTQPWIHLMDGGIADNLALRGMLYMFIRLQDDVAMMRRLARRTRRVLVISVDGEAAQDADLARQRSVGGLRRIFGAVSGTQIDAYNYETRLLTRRAVEGMVERMRQEQCGASGRAGAPCGDVRGGFVHLSLADVSNEALRSRLQAIPTGLTIDAADVDALLAQGRSLVMENVEIRSLLAKP